MLLNSIFHCGAAPYVRGEIALGKTVTLRLRLDKSLPVEQVFLRYAPLGEQAFLPAKQVEQDTPRAGHTVWWEVELPIVSDYTHYRFLLSLPDGNYWYNAQGVSRGLTTDACDFRILAQTKPPQWIYDAIFYQIFPDRYDIGDPSLAVDSNAYMVEGMPVKLKQWDEPLGGEGCNRFFYGGDLPGIRKHLEHIEALGANALYLNPIFTAASNHKYDVADYFNVDPHLGGNEALVALRQATRAMDMRLVLDIVPNHCGVKNSWFIKAQEDPLCPEAEFFTFIKHPDDYECWLNYHSLPRLNYHSDLLRERMYRGEESAFRHWLRPPYSIDGWRLDVSNMLAEYDNCSLGHEVAGEIRAAIKEENPQAWMLGEHFFDATKLLQGSKYDASMNYSGFTLPVIQWLCGQDYAAIRREPWGSYHYLPTEALVQQLTSFRAAIPEAVSLGELNLLDSHDTPRILTVAGLEVQRVMVGATMLFTYPGVPCIYYGDEIGLAGGCDPYCRGTMRWRQSEWNLELLQHYRRLCSLRKAHPALRYGGLQYLATAANSLAFMRECEQERVIVILGRGPVDNSLEAPEIGSCPLDNGCDHNNYLSLRAAGIADGTRFREYFTQQLVTVIDGKLPVCLFNNTLQSAVWLEEL